MNNSYIYIYHVNVTQTVPDISPLMPMHQDPLLVYHFIAAKALPPKYVTVKWGNFGRGGNFGQYKTFILSNILCHMKNNLVVNMEVKGYLQSVICFKRSFIRLDPMMS